MDFFQKSRCGIFVALLLFILISSSEILSQEILNDEMQQATENGNESKEEGSSDNTWENKKIAIGAGVFSGFLIGPSINEEPVPIFQFKILQLALMTWLRPHIPLSITTDINFDFNPGSYFTGIMVPLLINTGYEVRKGNLLWYFLGGGGANLHIGLTYNYLDPIVNLSSGLEWLISKSYSIGFRIRAGIIFLLDNPYRDWNNKNPNQVFIDLAISANLVL